MRPASASPELDRLQYDRYGVFPPNRLNGRVCHVRFSAFRPNDCGARCSCRGRVFRDRAWRRRVLRPTRELIGRGWRRVFRCPCDRAFRPNDGPPVFSNIGKRLFIKLFTVCK